MNAQGDRKERTLFMSHLLGLTEPPRYMRPEPDTAVPAVPRCLYCTRIDRPFTSEEHIIPEGLGNKTLVLPRGVVCDPCNNGPLSVLDQDFLDFGPVAMMRTFRGVPTKQGKHPKARFGNATLSQVGPSSVFLETNSRKAARPIPGGVRLNLIGGKRMTEAYVAQLVRWVFKAALGCIYIARGRAVAFSPQFDETRRIVLGDGFHGYLVSLKRNRPHESVHFTHLEFQVGGRTSVWAMADVFGVSIATDLLVRRARYFRFDRKVIDVHEF